VHILRIYIDPVPLSKSPSFTSPRTRQENLPFVDSTCCPSKTLIHSKRVGTLAVVIMTTLTTLLNLLKDLKILRLDGLPYISAHEPCIADEVEESEKFVAEILMDEEG